MIPGILSRHLAAAYLKAFFGALSVLTLIFLVVEFVDRSRDYTGDGWHYWAALLYANKALSVGYMLAPAAMLLACGVVVATLRRRGEYTAIRALAIGPWKTLLPIALCGALLCGALALAGEFIVGPAEIRVDAINATHFSRGGTWRQFYGEKTWLRGKRFFYHLRSGDPDLGFGEVTLYEISPNDFRLRQRIDAERMESLGGHRWRLLNGAIRDFDGEGDALTLTPFDEREIELTEPPDAFRIRKGYPEQMRFHELREQIARRQNVGLDTKRYELALNNKFASPLSGLPGLLLIFALTVRSSRRGRISATLAEAFFIIVLQWGMLVVFKAVAFADLLSPALSAWTPNLLLLGVSIAALRRYVR
ncbi:MAG: LptF/LptG family permease [Myxococcales bacterium]|jgi:lipopolysaccharide export system permease protein|nr:LptF/LptG family permease [Myxococcales bacterium]